MHTVRAALIASAITLSACAPRFAFPGAFQSYFAAVRAGRIHSICNDYARAHHGRLAIVMTEKGQPHMVAIDSLGFVRDNRVPGGPVWWPELPYRWVSVEKAIASR